MKIEVVLATNENSNIIKNLYPLYLYDLSEIQGNVPNKYGIYEDDEVKTLEEQYEVQNVWFQNPKELFPFIIFVDQMPAGFALLATGKYAPKSADYYLYEFFVLRPYRGRNIGEVAIIQVFNKFKGSWELDTNPKDSNKRAQGFWIKVLNNYTKGDFIKILGTNFNGERLIFRFNNKD